jgi:hypothetical protein
VSTLRARTSAATGCRRDGDREIGVLGGIPNLGLTRAVPAQIVGSVVRWRSILLAGAGRYG